MNYSGEKKNAVVILLNFKHPKYWLFYTRIQK